MAGYNTCKIGAATGASLSYDNNTVQATGTCTAEVALEVRLLLLLLPVRGICCAGLACHAACGVVDVLGAAYVHVNHAAAAAAAADAACKPAQLPAACRVLTQPSPQSASMT